MSMEGPHEHPQYTGDGKFEIDPQTGQVRTEDDMERARKEKLENGRESNP